MPAMRFWIAVALSASLLACGDLVAPVAKPATTDSLRIAPAPGRLQAQKNSNYAIGW
ncbi:MAG TPA: hypothetical protein VM716_14535 [Gemmatimonadales bacterium]|nr:hypothetical protein [Gemmatimonadales bacterium]